jgi:hypothetical protein
VKHIELDYQQPAFRPRRTAGWALLVAGVLLLAEMGVSYDRLQNDKEAMNQEIKASRIRLDTGNYGARQFDDKDLAQAAQIFSRLSTPWEKFFSGIESVSTKDIAILAIEPDVKTGQLKIEGEARDYAAVLNLVSKLEATPPFSEVFLVHHEIKRDDPQHPVSFAVSMHWMQPS